MGRTSRSEQFDPSEVCIVHVQQRCVRQAFLAGLDLFSGKSYEFRRECIRRRLELLSAVFGMDVLTYAILSNHLHIVLRSRPDIVQEWSDEQVATHWLQIFPGYRLEEHLAVPTPEQVQALCQDTERLLEIRLRLSDISWFMRAFAEPIARQANRQDGCKGCFWEGRFKAQKIVDEAGLLACAMYVDLNPIRAAMAESPELSLFTSAYDRIQALQGQQIVSAASELSPKAKRSQSPDQEPIVTQMARDQWLAPLELNERGPLDKQISNTQVRASDKGFLNMSLSDYLKLLDWTGRQGRTDKPGKIPDSLAPILERIGIDGSLWCDLVWNFKRYFGRSRALGKTENLKRDAALHHRQWVQGQRKAAACFT